MEWWPPMTDNLRDRIAAVLAKVAEGRALYAVTNADLAVMSDAVIAALKLHVVTVGDFQTVIKGSYPKPLEES